MDHRHPAPMAPTRPGHLDGHPARPRRPRRHRHPGTGGGTRRGTDHPEALPVTLAAPITGKGTSTAGQSPQAIGGRPDRQAHDRHRSSRPSAAGPTGRPMNYLPDLPTDHPEAPGRAGGSLDGTGPRVKPITGTDSLTGIRIPAGPQAGTGESGSSLPSLGGCGTIPARVGRAATRRVEKIISSGESVRNETAAMWQLNDCRG